MGRGPTGAFRLGYHPALDGVRGLAVVTVVLYHVRVMVWEDAGWWLPTGGYMTLDVFFALSGFLITCLLLADHERHGRVNLGQFMVRRARRLYPALAAVLAALVVSAAIGFGYHSTGDATVRSLWNLAFLHNWDFESRMLLEVGQIWSLAVEGQFYVLWSVAATVVLASFRRARVILAVAATLIVVAAVVYRHIRFANGDNPYFVYLSTPTRIDGPLVGSLAGLAYASGRLDRIGPRWATAMATAGLAGFAFIAVRGQMFDSYQRSWAGYTLNAGLGALIILGLVLHSQGTVGRALAWPPLVRCGQWSYSLFLWHMPVLVFLARNAKDVHPVPKAIVALVASSLLAVLSYTFVERPFLRKRRAPRARPRVATAPAEAPATAPPVPALAADGVALVDEGPATVGVRTPLPEGSPVVARRQDPPDRTPAL